MTRIGFSGRIDDEFEFDDDYEIDEAQSNFEKIPHKKKMVEEPMKTKRKENPKHFKRPDKD